METGRCRSCNAAIRWAVTKATGKRIPIDVDPVPGGNLLILPATADGQPDLCEALGLAARAAHPGPLFLSHFVTCPDGPAWRNRRKGA